MKHHRRLRHEVDLVAARYRRFFGSLACAIVWLAAAAVGAFLLLGDWPLELASAWLIPVLIAATVSATVVVCWLAVRPTWDPRWVARRIEARHPELNSVLLTAVQQEPQTPGAFGFLQDRVFLDALAHNRTHDWENNLSSRRIVTTQLTGLVSFGLLAFVLVALAGRTAQARRSPNPGLEPAQAPIQYEVRVAPGDTEIERGTSLVVTARFGSRLPDEAELMVADGSGQILRIPMSRSLSDPVFGARVPSVQTDLEYRITYAERETETFRAIVFEHPRLLRADAELEFPEYTSLPDKRVEDTRRITAVEGTELTLLCDLNKPVERARLVTEDGNALELAPAADDPTRYSATEVLSRSRRYRLLLTDADGRGNKEPPQIVIHVTPNRAPDVKVALPARDVRVSPIEELQTKASFWDDYGLRAYGVSYTLPGKPTQEWAIGRSTSGNERREAEHLIAFEELEAEPDQLLAYYFWAEDVGPDGKPRRKLGDMYFAEVRHFEEIFRQGEQPPSGQSQQQPEAGGNARQAEQLAELQKQIINATWTVVRRETGPETTDRFATDVEEIKTAQADAIDKLAELTKKLQDRQSQQHAEEVKGHMLDAMSNLIEATDAASPSTLSDALSAEQAAYQALLKLRAREHRVTRSRQPSQQRQSGSASGPQSRARQQLEQLELDNEENRYETQRQASPLQEREQRENVQVLNRLRELARRQDDLNKRLQELQSALEEAKTEEEKEEIRRRLKRLREQQRQMLRDMDELAQRMDRPENQERMSEQRQQLDQSRENIRQTTEALRQGQMSRAITSGTRAQRRLEEMKEQFRDAAANQFSEQVEQLRDDARRLDKQEKQLAEQLRNMDRKSENSRSLRETTEKPDLEAEFRRQRQDLENLLENIRETVEEAEEAEPLMAKQLYDSVREARQQRVDDALDAARRLADRGLIDEARTAEEQAGRGIETLKEGVEDAAESVLGNEEEALRRAQQTLEQLAEELNEEIRRATGRLGENEDEDSQSRPGSRVSAQSGEQRQAERGPEAVPRAGQTSGQQQPQQTERAAQGPPTAQEPQEPQLNEQEGSPAESDRQEIAEQKPPRDRPRDSDQDRPPSLRNQGRSRQTAASRPEGRGGRQTDEGPARLEQFRGPSGPITGEFLPWSDRLRDVEEMLDDPQLRSDVARVREAARDIRREMHRDFKGPNWDIVREFVAEPLNELRRRLAEELLRRKPDAELVPIDRDPVPAKYADAVRRYYENLGSGK